MIASNLSLEEKIGQMVIAQGFGRFRSSEARDYRALEELVTRYHVGGFKLYHGYALGTAMLIRRLNHISRVPLLFSADLEQGLGQQIVDAPRFPPAMALGAADDPDLAYAIGRAVASEAVWLGINTLFGPLLDLHAVADRYFHLRCLGADPQRIAGLAVPYIQGVRSAGAAAIAKYFPGHGSQEIMADGSSLVRKNAATLAEVDVLPFRIALSAPADGLVVGPAAFPAMDDTRWPSVAGAVPAMLSRRTVTGMLREELGFAGAIFTDALNLPFLRRAASARELARQAVRAGVDLLVALASPEDAVATVRGIHDALDEGVICAEQIDASVERILALKARLMEQGPTGPSLDADRTLGRESTLRLIEEVSNQAVCLLGPRPDGFPLARRPLVLPVIKVGRTTVWTELQGDPWQPWHTGSLPEGITLDTIFLEPGRSDVQSALGNVRGGEAILMLAEADPLALQALEACLCVLRGRGIRPILVLGVEPRLARRLAAQSWVAVWAADLGQASRLAAARVVLGLSPAVGHLPV